MTGEFRPVKNTHRFDLEKDQVSESINHKGKNIRVKVLWWSPTLNKAKSWMLAVYNIRLSIDNIDIDIRQISISDRGGVLTVAFPNNVYRGRRGWKNTPQIEIKDDVIEMFITSFLIEHFREQQKPLVSAQIDKMKEGVS